MEQEAQEKAEREAALAARRAEEERRAEAEAEPAAEATDEGHGRRRRLEPTPPVWDRGRERRGRRSDARGRRGRDLDERDEPGSRRRRKRTLKLPDDARRHGFERPTERIVREVEIPETIVVGDLAQRMAVKSGEVIKILMKLGDMSTFIQDYDTVIAPPVN